MKKFLQMAVPLFGRECSSDQGRLRRLLYNFPPGSRCHWFLKLTPTTGNSSCRCFAESLKLTNCTAELLSFAKSRKYNMQVMFVGGLKLPDDDRGWSNSGDMMPNWMAGYYQC